MLPAGVVGATQIAHFDAPAEWRAIDFLSDLHLGADTPHTFDAFAAYLDGSTADAIFILGDLFEAWVGDDLRHVGFGARAAAALANASQRRTIGFMVGNRDFLVGDEFLNATGLMHLADPTVVRAFGTNALLTHGDGLCIGDVGYQRFRSFVRNPTWQREFLAKPLAERVAIGRATRHESERRHTDDADATWIDLDRDATISQMHEAGVATLIHGHTHHPNTEEIAPGLVRHVMTDWDLDHSGRPRAELLRWHAGGIDRISLARGAHAP